MKLGFFLFFSILVDCCFSQAGPTTRMIDFAKGDYKLKYPETWRLDTSGSLGPELFVFSPLENDTDKFSENVNVLIQNLQGQNINLEQYKQITDKQLSDLATDGKIYESSILKTDKGEFFRITYAMTQGKYRIKITSICFIRNDKAYLATFSSEFDKYDNYKEVGEQILSSFSLLR
jgi:hypothetical protein